jgi:hypothetical protein
MSLAVDLHHHVIPDFYWEASNEDGNAAGPDGCSRSLAAGALVPPLPLLTHSRLSRLASANDRIGS